MPSPRLFLLAAALGLTPIALSYGANPQGSVPFLFGFPVETVNAEHIFRAVMGLYLGQAAFWVIGAIRASVTTAALWGVVVFMWGLAFGRIFSLFVDGLPSVLLVIYLLLEIGFGVVGYLLLRRRSPAGESP